MRETRSFIKNCLDNSIPRFPFPKTTHIIKHSCYKTPLTFVSCKSCPRRTSTQSSRLCLGELRQSYSEFLVALAFVLGKHILQIYAIIEGLVLATSAESSFPYCSYNKCSCNRTYFDLMREKILCIWENFALTNKIFFCSSLQGSKAFTTSQEHLKSLISVPI